MKAESFICLSALNTDGGPSKNAFLMQFQADILGIAVMSSGAEELSAVGAAYMSGISTGYWETLEHIMNLDKGYEKFTPKMRINERTILYKGWKDAVLKARLM